MAHRVSAAIVRLATVVLPAGPVRERYRREFLADLYVFDRRARLAFAFGILTDVVALRAAVGGDAAPIAERDFALARKPLLCRLHLHFRVRCVSPDGNPYHRCRRCGDDQYEYERHWDDSNVAANMWGANLNGGAF
jgi:hypothetical protein